MAAQKTRSFTCAGVMSGTSLDGIDVVLFKTASTPGLAPCKILAHLFFPYPQKAKQAFKNMAQNNDLIAFHRAGTWWAHQTHRLIQKALNQTKLSKVDVIGMHGQTVLHDPTPNKFLNEKTPLTLQVGNISALAALTGCPTVGQFRLGDQALGGQGAPLAPFAHGLLFGHLGQVYVQNMGGIGNVTPIHRGRVHLGFDTGPGNVWMDQVMGIKTNQKNTYDKNGQGARKGRVDQRLFANLLSHPFASKRPPKSADIADFQNHLLRHKKRLSVLSLNDALATVTKATAHLTAVAYQKYVFPFFKPKTIVVCGGGALNQTLLDELQLILKIPVLSSQTFGLPPQSIESLCFGLMGLCTLLKKPNHLPHTTGAKKQAILGELSYGIS